MRRVFFFLSVLCLTALAACQGQSGASMPTVIIVSPPHGTTFNAGETIGVQSSAADPTGISRVELLVDGVVVKQDAPPNLPAPVQFTIVQTWTATEGPHTLTVRALNPSGAPGHTGITVNVNAATSTQPTSVAQISPTNPARTVLVTATPGEEEATPATQTTTCSYDAEFVGDLTIPDSTPLTAGQRFTKTWRVRNTGSCVWEAGTSLAFAGGAQMGAPNAVAVALVNPGEITDISVSMQAPSAPNTYTGLWRFGDPQGNLFGAQLSVRIIVAAPNVATNTPPTASPAPTTATASCSGTPNDFVFSASATAINKGDTVTLTWSKVNNATGAFLSGGEFNNNGVETPGSRNARPPTTTTYVLRAVCGASGQTRDKSVTIQILDIANRGPLNGNFSLHPEFSPTKFSFFAFAGDIDAPCQGEDGCNIDRVDLYLFDPNGTRVHMRTERNPSYCAFGGGDNGNPCTFYVYADHGNKWPNGSPVIAGVYRMYAEAFSKDGRKKTIEDFIELNPQP